MLNKLSVVTTAQVEVLVFLVILVSPSSTAANPVLQTGSQASSKEQSQESSSKKVVDFNVHISEAGEEYNERIEVDPDNETELFQVPAHPGVDRSDTLNDFKRNLTMLRFPDSAVCYLLPLANEQSRPEKLIRDLEKAKQMVITEARRVDTTWIIDGEVTDRSVLSDELAQFCAKYSIYHVKKALDSLTATRIEKEERTNRKRRQNGMGKLCPGGMDLSEAFETCSGKPKLKCKVLGRTCYKYVICKWGLGPGEMPPPSLRVMSMEETNCLQEHIWRAIVCCEYICN